MRERIRATLIDVAREAGVSLATVDRVLNRRPGVRSGTVERVEQAMGRLGFRPDPVAARLARGTTYRFVAILPDSSNTFMRMLADQVERAAAAFAAQRVSLDLVRVDVFNPDALAATILDLAQRYEGLAVVALDHPRVRAAIDLAVESGVTVVTLVSDVPTSRRLRYVGFDNSAAGRTAATLMGRFTAERSGPVAVIVGSLALRDHAERLFGFRQVLGMEHKRLGVLGPFEGRDDGATNGAIVADLLARERALVGLYNVGAGNRGIARALEAAGRADDVVFIGHELTEFSRHDLLTGTMDAVINQDAGHEVRSSVRILMAARDDEPIVDDQERIRIDIFVRDNLP
jgi:LacI family transcriptional regulator